MNYMNSFKIKLFIALFLIKIIGILSISSGSNEPIAWTELGLLTRDCALSHCDTKDSLGLWLSLQNVCSGQNANPYFLKINSQETTIQETNYNNNVTPLICASLCAMSSVCSLMLGYVIAHHYHKKVVYTQLKDNDDF